MKLIKSLMIAVLFLIPFEAMADFSKFVGAEVQCNFHKDNTSTKAIPIFNLFTGIKLHENLGAEFGGYISGVNKMTGYTLHKKAVHASIVGYGYVCPDLRLRFGFGGAQLFATAKCNGETKKRAMGLLPRAFAGVEFDLCNGLTGRVNLIWEQTSLLAVKHKAFKNDSLHLNFGMVYNM